MTGGDGLEPIPSSRRPGHFLLVFGGAAVLLVLAFVAVLTAAGLPDESTDVPTSTVVERR